MTVASIKTQNFQIFHNILKLCFFLRLQIPNKGRGEAPIPAAVNDFVFTVFSHLSEFPEAYILVHCTHGYNRTGFMIASYIMRMLSTPTTKLPDVLKSFADARSPGIYKDYYVQYLFRYYHERPPRDYPPPSLPPWKAQASPDDGNDDGEFDDSMFRGAEGRGMHHDDHLGENISKTEGDWVRSILMQYILDREGVPSHRTMFPGSQPVSLARSNLDMLFKRRYWVTWKADGTRYLILIHRTGTYLIDRSNAVTRVQMRWPTPLPPWRPGCPRPDAPVGPFHVGTILDGEMVVDVDKATGICTRRFLAYDMMVLNGEPCLHQPWGKRWAVLKDYVENPRRFEQEEARKGKYRLRYDYAQEEFRFRRKDFWPLHMAHKVIHQFIPKAVCHEADGLILQPYADAYVPLTCDELLKWKFAHMNSVDFKLIVSSEGGVPVSKLQLLHPQKGGMAVLKFLEGAKVVFDKGEKPVDDPRELNTRIIECAWDPERQAWSFMRERRDKQYPNAFPVYELVVASIKDNIQDSDLLKTIDEAVKGDVYDEDMGRKKRPPAAAPQEMPANSAAAADGGDGQP